jgi:DNA-directed RNA polymerase subunit RPC12/RpoP
MTVNCEYCRSPNESGNGNCANCGAPLAGGVATDPHQCPYCARRLLALGSPNCSYCGRRLPEEFIKANTSDLNRIKELGGSDKRAGETLAAGIVERVTHADRSSSADSLVFDLTDLLS